METINLKFKSETELETLSKLLTYIHENFEEKTKRTIKLEKLIIRARAIDNLVKNQVCIS